MAIEVEIRSFLTEEQYKNLLTYFKENAEFVKEENDETEYYADQGAVRIRRTDNSAKLVLKTGNIHDEFREEHEIKIQHSDFPLFQKMFSKLKIPKQIKWQRHKHTFNWKGITAELGNNKGYGYIIELEKLTTPENKTLALQELKQKLSELKIPITPKEEFEKAYENYKNNWKNLLEED